MARKKHSSGCRKANGQFKKGHHCTAGRRRRRKR